MAPFLWLDDEPRNKKVAAFLEAAGCDNDIYDRATKVCPDGSPQKPLTDAEREQVERLSTERGYRRFIAEAL